MKYRVLVGDSFVVEVNSYRPNQKMYKLTRYEQHDIYHNSYFDFRKAYFLKQLFAGEIASAAEATTRADLQNEIAAPTTMPINANPEPLQLFPNELFKSLIQKHAKEKNGPDITDSLIPAIKESILTSITRQQHSTLTAARKFIGKNCL